MVYYVTNLLKNKLKIKFIKLRCYNKLLLLINGFKGLILYMSMTILIITHPKLYQKESKKVLRKLIKLIIFGHVLVLVAYKNLASLKRLRRVRLKSWVPKARKMANFHLCNYMRKELKLGLNYLIINKIKK